MKRYILMRILRSLVSIFLVTTAVYIIVYTLVPKSLIFKQDPNYTKMVTTPDKKANYENTILDKMNYIDYMDSKDLTTKVSKAYDKKAINNNQKNKSTYQKYITQLGNGWVLHQFKESKQFYATRNIPIYERVWDFYSHLIQIDTPWAIHDKSNPNLKRYVKFEKDKSVGFSLVGSGTKHKYLIYFNSSFPFIHQNIITLNLGTSYPTFANVPVLQVITEKQGNLKFEQVKFPKGTTMSPVDIYSRTYKSPKDENRISKMNYGAGDAYTNTNNNHESPSMISNSFRIGIVGIVIAYILAIPISIYMARFKDKWFDRMSTAVQTFLLSLPSIALAYILRFLGSLVGLPDTFPQLGASDIRSYIMPAIILGVLSTPGLVIWLRRYLIDQQSSDYVRFARAKGLSESEITRKHIFKHAMVPIVAGIPASIMSTIIGATLTESIFAFPGMGKMLIDAVSSANNTMVIGLTFIFTTISVLGLLLGDILMTIIDPRIKLSTKKGGK